MCPLHSLTATQRTDQGLQWPAGDITGDLCELRLRVDLVLSQKGFKLSMAESVTDYLILMNVSSFIAGIGKKDANSNVYFWEKTIFTSDANAGNEP